MILVLSMVRLRILRRLLGWEVSIVVRFRPLRVLRSVSMILVSDAMIWNIGSVDKTISSGRKVIGLACSIVSRGVIYLETLLLELVPHE